MTRDHGAIIRAAIDSGRMMIVPAGVDLARRTAAAAASPPCPDCGQGWPDGCDADCPTRHEDDPRPVVAYDAPAGTLCPVCGQREHWRDASPVFYPSDGADAIPAGATCAGCGEVLVTEE